MEVTLLVMTVILMGGLAAIQSETPMMLTYIGAAILYAGLAWKCL